MNYQQVINQIFQQYLGRSPNASEMQGFGNAMQQGYLDPIGLTMFVQSSAQYQQQQIPQIAQQYANQLGPLMNQASQNQLNQGYSNAIGQFAQLGRPVSSGLGAQFAQVAGNIAAQNAGQVGQQVGGYLGNAYGNMYGIAQQGANPYFTGLQNYQNFNYNRTLQADQAYQNSQNSIGAWGRNWANVNNYAGLGSGLLAGAGKGYGAFFGQGNNGGGAGGGYGAGAGGLAPIPMV